MCKKSLFSRIHHSRPSAKNSFRRNYVRKFTIIILETLLADGPVPVSEINEIMAEDGIGSKTAQRAKTRLGAVQEYVDGVPVRLLPGD